MNNWLSNIFPCCNSRNKDTIQTSIEGPPSIQVCEVESDSLIQIQRLPEDYITPSFNDPPSDDSTKESFASLERQNLLLTCHDCSRTADGYCLGCPDKRFCIDCYRLTHSNKLYRHRFLRYNKANQRHNSSLHSSNLT